jgi:opacity protein-like surface antigen
MLGCVGLSAAAIVSAATLASAADMPRNPPPVEPYPLERPAPQFFGNYGWYLRGDVAYRFGAISGASAAPGFIDPTDSKISSSMAGGIGGGIKTEWLRTDVTLEYGSPMKYDGMIATPSDVTAKISALTGLFNAYLDLGTWYGLTPYIGAGAGASYVRAYDYSSALAPPFAGDLSHSQWKFTYAGMAGVGYAISRNSMIDIGYRYINFGDVTTGSDAFGAMTFKNVAAHEIRVGLRWSFDDFPVAR